MEGPPYVADDPEPTDYQHYGIYLFASATNTQGGTSGAAGLDFNYDAAPDLQLTAVLPVAYESPRAATAVTGPGNIELAAKYRVLHQAQIGWDVAVFPRLFLPSASARVGDRHASLLLPLWLERDWGKWSTFGGGCEINRGGGSKDFCLAGWALSRQVLPNGVITLAVRWRPAALPIAHAGLIDLTGELVRLAARAVGVARRARRGRRGSRPRLVVLAGVVRRLDRRRGLIVGTGRRDGRRDGGNNQRDRERGRACQLNSLLVGRHGGLRSSRGGPKGRAATGDQV